MPKDVLIQQIKELTGKSTRHAALIARDQTAKATEALNMMQQADAGVEYFEWDTARDERVSTGPGGHKQLQGKIYKYGGYENYPVIDSDGNRGIPSERINCRCTALAVFLRPGWTMKQNKDGSYRPVKINEKSR
jgi:SPP1 gp7 family putative phage head morphogenesis protein